MRSPVVHGVVTGAEGRTKHKRFEAISDGFQTFENRLINLNIAPEIVGQLLLRHTDFSYSKGKIIFFSGAPADMLYCVRKGLVSLYAPTEDGNRVLVRIAGPGDLLGNFDLTADHGQSRQVWEAHARCNSQLALISREHIARTLQTVDRATLIQLFEVMNAEWSLQMARWVRFLGLDYRRRLELVLEELVVRFGVAEARGMLLTPEFNHSDFAEMIASSRPLASKLIGEMIEEGVLIQQGRQYIVPGKSAAGN